MVDKKGTVELETEGNIGNIASRRRRKDTGCRRQEEPRPSTPPSQGDGAPDKES